MINYLRADLGRIYKRIPRAIVLGFFYALALGIEIYVVRSQNTIDSVSFTESVVSSLNMLMIGFGLVETNALFSDDFKAHSISYAIGSGISRRRIVAEKLIASFILVLTDMAFGALLFMIMGTFTGVKLQGYQLWTLTVVVVMGAVQISLILSLVMFFIIYVHGSGAGLVVFLIMCFDPLDKVLIFLSDNKIVQSLHLKELTYSSVSDKLMTQLNLGIGIPAAQLLGVIIYFAIGFGLAMLVFKKQEPEF